MTDQLLIFNSAKDLRSKGYALREAPFNIVSYDPAGDGEDRDSLVLLSREEWRRGELWDIDLSVEFIFRALMAYRIPLDMEFPDKIAQILALHRYLSKWQLQGKSSGHAFVVETNGVGYGVTESLRSKINAPVIGYVTVAKPTDKLYEAKRLSMPRLAALDYLRVMLELHRLKSVQGAPGIELLIEELNAFVWKRPGRPEALKGARDDLVMALAGGVWIGSKVLPPLVKQKKFPQSEQHVTHAIGRIRVQ